MFKKSRSEKIIQWTLIGLLIPILLLLGFYFLLDKKFLIEEPAIVFTLPQYKQKLENRQKQEENLLPAERKAIQKKLLNLEQSYKRYINNLSWYIGQLNQELEGARDESSTIAMLLQGTVEALQTADDQQADALLADLEQQNANDKLWVGKMVFQRGSAAEDNIRYGDALKHYQKAAALVPNNVLYLRSAGKINTVLGNYQQAIRYFERALAQDLKTHGEDHPEVARERNNLGAMWYALHEYEKAIAYFEQALASDIKTYGEDHPDVATDRNNLGTAWYALGEYEKAIAYFEQALASDIKTYGEDHSDVVRERNNLGLAWSGAGEHEKAIVYFERALASLKKTSAADHPHVQMIQKNLSSTRAKLKEIPGQSTQDSSAGGP